LVLLQQRPLPGLQVAPPRVVFTEKGQLDLDPDEVGSLGLAVLFQKVGVDEPHPVVVGAVDDRLEEGVLTFPAHRRPPARPVESVPGPPRMASWTGPGPTPPPLRG